MKRETIKDIDSAINDLKKCERNSPPWLEGKKCLPFELLSWEEFEILSYLLLLKENPNAEIYYFGKTGDLGRDIIIIDEKGKKHLIQCKHYSRRIGVGTFREEIAKLYVNVYEKKIPYKPTSVTFYVAPDLTGPALDFIGDRKSWKKKCKLEIKKFLKKNPCTKLLNFADSWWPKFKKPQTAVDLTKRVLSQEELLKQFFTIKSVIECDKKYIDNKFAEQEQFIQNRLNLLNKNIEQIAIAGISAQSEPTLSHIKGDYENSATLKSNESPYSRGFIHAKKISSEKKTLNHEFEKIEKNNIQEHIPKLVAQIENELKVWNSQTAVIYARQFEDLMDRIGQEIDPEILILLARVYIYRAEVKRSTSEVHLRYAANLLIKAENVLDLERDVERIKDIFALRALIKKVEKGPEYALTLLEGKTDPFAIRFQLSILLDLDRIDDAHRLINEKSPHIRWCDIGITVLILKNQIDKAKEYLNWASEQQDRLRYHQCIIRMADGLLVNFYKKKAIKSVVYPILKEHEKIHLEEILSILEPILSIVKSIEKDHPELYLIAVKITHTVNELLMNFQSAAEWASLLINNKPIPLEIARSVLKGTFQPPDDILDRLRNEHPEDLEAQILSTVIQCSIIKQPQQAFINAKQIMKLADDNEKKERLSSLLMHISQELEGDDRKESEELAESFVEHNQYLRTQIEAAILIRDGTVTEARQLLESIRNEDDVEWLQLYSNVLIQEKRISEAVDYLYNAATMLMEPTLFHKTGDYAYQTNKFDIALTCYKHVVRIHPHNMHARNNLAHLYTFIIHDLDSAVEQFKVMLDMEPDNQVHKLNLAICLAKLYRNEESLLYYNDLCEIEKPDIKAVLGRAELLLSIKDAETAFNSLKKFYNNWGDNQDFLIFYYRIATAAGHEIEANKALQELKKLHQAGKSDLLKPMPIAEGIEMISESKKEVDEQNKKIETEIAHSRLPWIWGAQFSYKPFYFSWRVRTQPLDWITDDLVTRAQYSVYSTNSFHTYVSDDGILEFRPLECPPAGTTIAADISSLITMHRLGILDVSVDYFGIIILPTKYLETVLEDSKQLIPPQKSRKDYALLIDTKISEGNIRVINKDQDKTIPYVNEHNEPDEKSYRIMDLIRPIYNDGLLSEELFNQITSRIEQKNDTEKPNAELKKNQEILVEMSTLETLVDFNVLDDVLSFYNIYCTENDVSGIRLRIRRIEFIEEAREWHLDLWDHIRDDGRFQFQESTINIEKMQKDIDQEDNLSLVSGFLANDMKLPLLIDDRVCQALKLNEKADLNNMAFGTDVLILALLDAGRINKSEALQYFLELMRWRYRFLVLTPDLIFEAAHQYRNNPPGLILKQIAEYTHDCMNDPGLLSGSEKTIHSDYLTTRFYLTWISNICEFLIKVWAEKAFSNEKATVLTDWAIKEFLPSPPKVIDTIQRKKIASNIPRYLLSRLLISTNNYKENKQFPEMMMVVKKSLRLSKDEYFRLITGILHDTKNG